MKHEAIVRRIQLTEKGSAASELQNQYFFEVAPGANKIEIKQAVEQLFGVKVDSVNTMRYDGKKKRSGRSMRYGTTPDWKRAVVTLKEGSRIDLA